MNPLEAALVDLAGFLSEARIPYMAVGGFANLRWGRPRLTQDLDLTIQVPDSKITDLLEQLAKRYRLLATDPLAFVHETRVVPLTTAADVRVDLILAGVPYEEFAIRRAVPVSVAGVTVNVCTPEDLVLHKLASGRPRDREDVEGIILRQGVGLERAYMEPLVHEIAAALDQPEIVEFYRACLAKAGVFEG